MASAGNAATYDTGKKCEGNAKTQNPGEVDRSMNRDCDRLRAGGGAGTTGDSRTCSGTRTSRDSGDNKIETELIGLKIFGINGYRTEELSRTDLVIHWSPSEIHRVDHRVKR